MLAPADAPLKWTRALYHAKQARTAQCRPHSGQCGSWQRNVGELQAARSSSAAAKDSCERAHSSGRRRARAERGSKYTRKLPSCCRACPENSGQCRLSSASASSAVMQGCSAVLIICTVNSTRAGRRCHKARVTVHRQPQQPLVVESHARCFVRTPAHEKRCRSQRRRAHAHCDHQRTRALYSPHARWQSRAPNT